MKPEERNRGLSLCGRRKKTRAEKGKDDRGKIEIVIPLKLLEEERVLRRKE